MDAQEVLEWQWPYLLTFLPRDLDVEASARQAGALCRRRGVKDAATLLRLALAYGFCGLSLRQTAAWAQVSGVASVSDVALWKRLRGAEGWLGQVLGLKVAERAVPGGGAAGCVRIVDATTISAPGSTGTDWRLHLGYDAARWAIDRLELTDARGGESLTRFSLREGEWVIGDRGYAHRRGLWWALRQGGEFLVRLNWQNVPLQHPDCQRFDLLGALRSVPEGEAREFPVQTAPDRPAGIPALSGRLVALGKTEPAAAAARASLLRHHAKKSKVPDPRTLEAAGYVFVLTSIPAERLPTPEVLQWYRFRWQIEIVFKRLKGLLALEALPAKDPALARSFLYAKLLAALMLDDFTHDFLAFSPWGFRLGGTPALPVAYPASPAR